MAKTAQDYINIGRGMAVADSPRPEGNSWQAKAQQAGYDGVMNAGRTPGIGRGSVEVRECYPVAHNPTTADIRPQAVPQKQQTQNAVQSHINALLHSAQTAETMKGAKLHKKAFALALKWRAKGISLAI